MKSLNLTAMNTINKPLKYAISGLFALVVLFGFGNTALASTPTINVSSTGNNQVNVSVTNADPNSNINFYYIQPSNSAVFVSSIGTTNSSGYFSTTLNQNSYSIPQNSSVFVIINGQQSPSVMWPYNNANYGNVSLSQTSVTIGYNQSLNINVYGGNGAYYVSSNSNSSLASATLNGSVLNIYSGNVSGTATITVCSYNTSGCATLSVYVQTSYNQPTYLSQSSINLSTGQGQAITIYGSGSYSISSNSNPTAISALISGSILNVYGSAPGSGTLNVCSSYGGGCATLTVSVGGYGYNGYNNYYNGYNGYTGYNYNYNGYNNGYNTYYTTDQSPYYTTSYVNSYSNQSNGGRVLGAQVSLGDLPATGISFANLKTILFALGIAIWSLFAAYIYMAKQKRNLARR